MRNPYKCDLFYGERQRFFSRGFIVDKTVVSSKRLKIRIIVGGNYVQKFSSLLSACKTEKKRISH